MVHEQAVDAVIDIKRNEAIGQDSLFGGDAETEAFFDVPIPEAATGTSPPGSASSARCSGCTSPTTRCFGVEHLLAREADCSLADLLAPRIPSGRGASGDRDDGAGGQGGAASCPGSSAR